MPVGRPPHPTQLRVLRGNNRWSKARQKAEPKPIGDLKQSPDHFDAETRAVWDYAIEHAPPGLLKMLDASVLEAWCVAHVLHRRAVAEVRKSGLLVKAPNTGLPIQSPYLPVVNKQALIMLRAVDHLGFSPASRTRIVVGGGSGNDADAWSEIAAG